MSRTKGMTDAELLLHLMGRLEQNGLQNSDIYARIGNLYECVSWEEQSDDRANDREDSGLDLNDWGKGVD